MPELVCPKCQSEMRSYERNGVTVDQCTGCRGVFLDRGELERLVDAETAFYDRPTEPPRREPEPRRDEQHRGHRDRDDWRPGYGHGHGKRKKKSFLDDIFDFG
jgi:uncharacterized protein